jgi:L-fucose mutarotase/ribose pyranase (RbsD/FucU family)
MTADFSSYREQLSQVNFDNLFASDDIDSITRSIVKILINEADKAIPNRIITVRKDNPPWLTTEIKKNIRKKIDNTNVQKKVIWRMTGQDFDELGTDATNVINSKNDFFTKLSSKIASESRGSKQYWNIIKSLMNYDSTNSRYIPPYK